MPTDEYFCERCNDGVALTKRVYRVPRKIYNYQKDNKGSNILTSVDIEENTRGDIVYHIYCYDHYCESRVDDFLTMVKSWQGEPYAKIGCWKGVGVNCLGIFVGAAREYGLKNLVDAAMPYIGYERPFEKNSLLSGLRRHLLMLPVSEAKKGDLLLYRTGDEPSHLAIITREGYIFDATSKVGKAAERQRPANWTPLKAFRIKELYSE